MSQEVIKTVTCYGCPHAACFVKAHIVDGVLVKVSPDPDKIFVQNCTRGFMDNDGRASIEYHYMKNRINYPLKRVGERGENKWEAISWDQALDEIAGKMGDLIKKHGPNCVSVNTGTAHHSDNNWVPWRFHVAIGGVNHTGHEHICYGAQMISMEHTFGWVVNPYPSPGHFPKCMVKIGNSYEAMPHAFQMMDLLWKAGTKLIVVDPRCTESARRATIWLQERPGSDLGLWLCWIRTIMTEGWYDQDFVVNWSNAPFLVRTDTGKMLRGFELDSKAGAESFVVWNGAKSAPAIWDAEKRTYAHDGVQQELSGTHTLTLADGTRVECRTAWDLLAEQVAEWTPERAEEYTWVPKQKILDACEVYAKETPGFFVTPGHAYDAYAPGSSAVYRCRDILRILTGSIDKTEMITGCYDTNKVLSIYDMELRPDEAFSAEEKAKQAGFDRFKALGFEGFDLKAKYAKRQWGVPSNAMWSCQAHPHLMWRDILDGKEDRLRCLIMSGSNPLLKYGNVRIVYEAMKRLDLTIALEFVMTPSAQMADYVLPMSDWFERPEIGPSTPCDIFNLLHVSGAAMEPEYERRNDYDVFRGLAVRMGLEKYFPWKDLTEAYNYRMAGILKQTGCKDINEFGEKIGFDYPEPIADHYKLKNGFATPTAKAELWSVMLEEMGYEPLPRYYEPAISPYSTPELAERYPLILIGIDRHLPMYHTMFFEVPALRKMCPNPVMDIHPDTARRMDPPITDGDWVWVETRRGRIRQRARLTFGIDPRVVKVQHHWWFPEKPGEEPYLHGVWESNTNVITEDDPDLCDPVFGSWPHTSILCRVYKETDGSHLEEDRTC